MLLAPLCDDEPRVELLVRGGLDERLEELERLELDGLLEVGPLLALLRLEDALDWLLKELETLLDEIELDDRLDELLEELLSELDVEERLDDKELDVEDTVVVKTVLILEEIELDVDVDVVEVVVVTLTTLSFSGARFGSLHL